MGKTVAVSFEEDSVKIVHASLKGNEISIDRAEIIPNDQFDNYLQKEKSKEFVVTHDFNESYHNVVTIPIVRARHLEKVVESEIRRATEIKDFSFIYTPLGERVIENKKVFEVSYFAVKNEELRNVVKRFYDNGKIVKALYPTVFSTIPLFKSKDEATIGVLGTKTEKSAFLIKKGAIYFIRKFKSLTEDLSDIDIQDINMTINYCLQNIRINPSSILLAGSLSRLYNVSIAPSVPIASLYKADYIHCSEETFNDFIVPISSLHASRASNILSKEFKNIYMLKNYIVNASRFFIILTLLCLGFILYDVRNIVNTKAMLESMKKNNADIVQILSDYTTKETEIKRYMPVINFLNKSTSGIQRLLTALGKMDIKNSKFDSIEATAKEDSFLVTINGTTNAKTYTSTQASFQDIVDSLSKIENIKITDKTIDINKKTFSIKMEYR